MTFDEFIAEQGQSLLHPKIAVSIVDLFESCRLVCIGIQDDVQDKPDKQRLSVVSTQALP
jgi:hypothetical protein